MLPAATPLARSGALATAPPDSVALVAPDGRRLICRRSALAAGSQLLARQLAARGAPPAAQLWVTGIDSAVLAEVAAFLNEGTCRLCLPPVYPSAVDLLDAAARLEVATLVNAVSAFLRSSLGASNVCAVIGRALAHEAMLGPIIGECLDFATDARRFGEVAASRDFATCSLATVSRLLAHLVASSNGSRSPAASTAAWRWLSYEPTRITHIDQLKEALAIPDGAPLPDARGVNPQPQPQPQAQAQPELLPPPPPFAEAQRMLWHAPMSAAAAPAAAAAPWHGGHQHQHAREAGGDQEVPDAYTRRSSSDSDASDAGTPLAAAAATAGLLGQPSLAGAAAGGRAAHAPAHAAAGQLDDDDGAGWPCTPAAATARISTASEGSLQAAEAMLALSTSPLLRRAAAAAPPGSGGRGNELPASPTRLLQRIAAAAPFASATAVHAPASGRAGTSAVAAQLLASGFAAASEWGDHAPPHQHQQQQHGGEARARRGSAPGAGARKSHAACCQICGDDLHGLRPYYARYKICEHHAKAPVVQLEGAAQRFCQQCGRFHPVALFTGMKRSCTARLARHNERRRKHPCPGSEDGSGCGEGDDWTWAAQ